jgi:hypothetical protein
LKTVLIIIGVLSLASLAFIVSYFYRVGKPVNPVLSDSYYYHAWKDKMIYSPMGNWFELGYTEFNANPKTFSVLSREFGKDSESVFWKGKIQRVQHDSFVIDSQRVPKDAKHVYYDLDFGDSLKIIEGADSESYARFTPIKELYYYDWARDNQAVYVNGKKLEVDRKTFTVLNSSIAADTSHLYIIKLTEGQLASTKGAVHVIRKAPNPGTAKVISANYIQFGNHIALSNWKNEFAMLTFDQIDSVKVIDERNLIINSTLLVSDGEQINDVDITTLEILNRDFIKDKSQVFYDRQKIAGADAASFTPVYEEYSKDKTHVFYKNQILAGANPATFTYNFATGIASDGRLRFKDGLPVK